MAAATADFPTPPLPETTMNRLSNMGLRLERADGDVASLDRSNTGQRIGFGVSDETDVAMAELDVDAMIERFRNRAEAVRERPLPPVAGSERKKFIEQAETDYLDFALVGNATWVADDEYLVLRIPLNPRD
jgi:hypothetical protein